MDLQTAINWIKVCQNELQESIGNGEIYFKISILNGIELNNAFNTIINNYEGEIK